MIHFLLVIWLISYYPYVYMKKTFIKYKFKNICKKEEIEVFLKIEN